MLALFGLPESAVLVALLVVAVTVQLYRAQGATRPVIAMLGTTAFVASCAFGGYAASL